MRKAAAERTIQVLDARSPGRFAGAEPEPRTGLRSGHIPGSRNLFFKRLIDETSHRFKPIADLEALYREAGVDLGRVRVLPFDTDLGKHGDTGFQGLPGPDFRNRVGAGKDDRVLRHCLDPFGLKQIGN